MLLSLFEWLQSHGYVRVSLFGYITFRTAAALLTAFVVSLLLGPYVIAILRALKAGQPIRTATSKDAINLADMHGSKKGTPTMGGILIFVSVLVPSLLWCDLRNTMVWLLLFVGTGSGILGFADDYIKVSKRDAGGLPAIWKLLGTLGLGLGTGVFLYLYGKASYSWTMGNEQFGPHNGFDHIAFPFLKNLYPALGWGFALWVLFIITGSSHAVNLTDGLDGLCIGITTMVAVAYTIIAYLVSNRVYATYLLIPHVPAADDVVVILGALVGACLGFLWFNAHPAQMFMGDTGSLLIGGLISTAALITKQEILLAIIGGVYVIEAGSVIIQVTSYKLRKKRVFLMSPIHHHFEKLGWPETKIIARFYIVTALLAMAGLATFKLR